MTHREKNWLQRHPGRDSYFVFLSFSESCFFSSEYRFSCFSFCSNVPRWRQEQCKSTGFVLEGLVCFSFVGKLSATAFPNGIRQRALNQHFTAGLIHWPAVEQITSGATFATVGWTEPESTGRRKGCDGSHWTCERGLIFSETIQGCRQTMP